jgi:hypothetical protein
VTDTLCEAVRLVFTVIGLPLRIARWAVGEPEVRR